MKKIQWLLSMTPAKRHLASLYLAIFVLSGVVVVMWKDNQELHQTIAISDAKHELQVKAIQDKAQEELKAIVSQYTGTMKELLMESRATKGDLKKISEDNKPIINTNTRILKKIPHDR